MASIFQIKKNNWKARVSTYLPNGDRKITTKSGFASKKEAQYWANDLEMAKTDGLPIIRSKSKFSDYFLNWYQTFKEPTIATRTKSSYMYTYKTICDYFSGEQIARINKRRYREFLNEFGSRYSQKSISKIHNHIKNCVATAIEEGAVKIDFTNNLIVKGRPGKKKEMKYLDAKDFHKLTQYLQKDLSVAHLGKLMCLVAIYTGARFGEVSGLTWDDIDLDKKTIHIHKQWDAIKRHGFIPTKTEESNRTISINPNLVDMLADYQHLQQMTLSTKNVENPYNLLFWKLNSKVPDSSAVNHLLHDACKKLKIKDITFHGLRHTHASFLIYQGVSIYYISQRLGHSSYSTTLSVYGHVMRELTTKESKQSIDAMKNL